MHVEEANSEESDDDDQSVIKRVHDEGGEAAMEYDYEQEDSV